MNLALNPEIVMKPFAYLSTLQKLQARIGDLAKQLEHQLMRVNKATSAYNPATAGPDVKSDLLRAAELLAEVQAVLYGAVPKSLPEPAPQTPQTTADEVDAAAAEFDALLQASLLSVDRGRILLTEAALRLDRVAVVSA